MKTGVAEAVEIASFTKASGLKLMIGGMVEKGSIQRQDDGVTITFVAEEGATKQMGLRCYSVRESSPLVLSL